MLPNINNGTAGPRYSYTACVLSWAQCAVSLLDLRTVSLSVLDSSTVADCPEDSESHIFVWFNLIKKHFAIKTTLVDTSS